MRPPKNYLHRNVSTGKYRVRWQVPKALQRIVGKTTLIGDLDTTDHAVAVSRSYRWNAEFQDIIDQARRELAGSEMVYRTIHPPRRLEYNNLDPETSDRIRRLVHAHYPNLDLATERGIFGRQRVHQRADTPAPVRQKIVVEPVLFDAMVKAWAQERKPRASLGQFESKMAALAKFLGHQDMRRVSRDDLNRFKEHLLKQDIKPITVKNYLLIIKTIFNFAAENGRIKENPAKLVKFQPKKDPLDKRQGFTPEERVLILTEARKAIPVIRWAVWISYFSGCRLSEITQAKTGDFRREGSSLVLSTGSKTEGSVRRFPLHSAVLREGFEDFLKTRDGALFPPGNHSRILNDWLRDIGIDDRRKVFHSLRHQFKSLAREARIEREIHDAITGHSDGSASTGYGETPIATMAEAIERISDPTREKV